ncbi:hypothetical protein QLQ09_23920 [Brucella sp. NM4]|nr:hypothetical protein [Brucella sp. NM4]WHS33895.1 hypothetical protein QLQ09_23920 [Brucella sp. NM4]
MTEIPTAEYANSVVDEAVKMFFARYPLRN